jgi:hypothetical protein
VRLLLLLPLLLRWVERATFRDSAVRLVRWLMLLLHAGLKQVRRWRNLRPRCLGWTLAREPFLDQRAAGFVAVRSLSAVVVDQYGPVSARPCPAAAAAT